MLLLMAALSLLAGTLRYLPKGAAVEFNGSPRDVGYRDSKWVWVDQSGPRTVPHGMLHFRGLQNVHYLNAQNG